MPAVIPVFSAAKTLPLVQTLKQLPKLGKGTNTINIVDPKLCDDVIQRLGPSLKPHVGCSIIDLNPGPALWSSKVHEFLQPQSHVLVEPDPSYHDPFLKPLLEATGSRYHLRSWEIAKSFDLHRYIREGLIPSSQVDRNAGGTATQRNDSILILANATRGERKRRGRGKYESHFRAQTFCSSLQRMDGLNAQGPVRMLMWLPDAEKQTLLPRTVSHRTQLSLVLELYFHIEEIVTASRQAKERRETFIDIESGKRVARRMEAANIQIPQDRQDETQIRAKEALAKSSRKAAAQVRDDPREWEKELQELEEAYANKLFSEYSPGVRRGDGPQTPQFKRLQVLRHMLTFSEKRKVTLDGLLAEEDQIDALQIDLLYKNLTPEEREAATVKRDQIYKTFKDHVASSAALVPKQLAFRGDDRRAFALDPPLLMWDRRIAEPLLASENEFYHTKRASLLDFQPLTPRPYPLTEEQWIYFDYILKTVLHYGNLTIKHLQSLAPGAFEALLPHVPSLVDPLKGGRAKHDELRARCLTPEMAHGLAMAWERWPLRPEIVDTISFDRGMEDVPGPRR
ncbi:MAG: hypothetical protein Q9195_003394 [Heterodermia aff. obscurata]